MNGELTTLLATIAPEVGAEVDLERVVRRGRTLRRRRRAATAAGVAAGLVLAITAVRPVGLPWQPSVVGAISGELAQALDESFAQAVADLELPGATAALVTGDGAVWTAAAGQLGDASGTAVDADTAFSLDHLTELVTMAAVADLVADGAIDLADPVSRWVPEVAGDATVADLLQHRSGLPDVAVTLDEAWRADPMRRWTAAEVIDAGVAAADPPGGAVRYADTDAVVLGRILELADGRSLASSVRSRVLEPLDAGRVGFQPLRGTDVALPDPATAATTDPSLVPFPAWATGDEAATGMVGTAADTALLLHALLTEPTTEPLRSVLLDWQASVTPGPDHGAAGLRRGSHNGWREVWRADTGGTPGYRAAMLHVPDLGATIVVMANRGHERPEVGTGPSLLDAVAAPLLDATVDVASAAAPARVQVWAADADGGDARPLTDWPGQAIPMDWSPDGAQVLVQSDRDGDWDLWLVASDGSSWQQLTDEPGMESFARFSPDGSRVAFTDNLAVDADLWVVGVDGQGMTKLVGGTATHEWNPAWSPDGRTLLFTRTPHDRPAVGELWSVTADGTGARRIDVGTAGVGWADWSPDGTRLVVWTVDGRLVLSGPDGSDPVPLEGIELAWHPRWVDDRTLTFAVGGVLDDDGLVSAGPASPRDVWQVDLDGGRPRPLLVRPGDQSLPVWAPDGSRLAFAEAPAP